MLEIKNLTVSMNDKELLHGVNMCVADGARHLLRGPNGGGKSTLANTIAGDVSYHIAAGKIILDGRDLTDETPTARALAGIFLGAQNVPEIPGLTVMTLLKYSATAHAHFQTGRDLSMAEFLERVDAAREQLNIPRDWLNRSVNVGFSGGERKKIMLMRLVMTQPRLAILDEPDSGADAATREMIANTIHRMPNTSFLVVSHQPDFINLITPTAITTIEKGRIITD